MGKVLPAAWHARAVEHAAGAGRRRRSRRGAAHARQRAAAEAGRFLAGDRPGPGLHAARRFPARARPARRGAGRLDDAGRPAYGALLSRPRQFRSRPLRPGGRRLRRHAGRPHDASGAARAAPVALRGPGPRPARRARPAGQGRRQREPRPNGRRRSPSSCWASCRPASSRSRPRPTRPPSAPTASAPPSFFIGMDALRRGDKQRAREQLQLTQARCPTVSELNWAASERAEAALACLPTISRRQSAKRGVEGPVLSTVGKREVPRLRRPSRGFARDDGAAQPTSASGAMKRVISDRT